MKEATSFKNLPSIEDCIKFSGNDLKHLIIGNGFSIKINNGFNYNSLKKQARDLLDFSGQSDIVRNFLDSENCNFEEELKRISTKINQLKMYHIQSEGIKLSISQGTSTNDALDNLNKSIKELKHSEEELESQYSDIQRLLIDAITKIHPKKPRDIASFLEGTKPDMVSSLIYFLKHFSSIYTLNYDLILYWIFSGTNDQSFSDNFKISEVKENLRWASNSKANFPVYYLHGALHIFEHGGKTYKHKYHRGHSLMEQVKKSLSNKEYPLFISEGTKETKKQCILSNKNGYLHNAYESLKNISGSLFVFGHGLLENDDHIYEQIFHKTTRIKNCYVGIYSEKDFENYKEWKKKINCENIIPFSTSHKDSEAFIWSNKDATPIKWIPDELKSHQDSPISINVSYIVFPAIGLQVIKGKPFNHGDIIHPKIDEAIKENWEKDFRENNIQIGTELKCEINYISGKGMTCNDSNHITIISYEIKSTV